MCPARFTVLGAAGFIGRHLVAHLRGCGHVVETPGRAAIQDDGPGSRSLSGRSLGHVVYCIGLTADFRDRPVETMEAHVGRLLGLFRKADFDSVLYLSSTRVYAGSPTGCEDQALRADPADPDCLYNISKLAGEALCLSQSDPRVRVARLSNVYGPGMQSDSFLAAVAREARSGLIHLASAPQSAKDYLAVAEAVDALRRIALAGETRLYNVASGRTVDHATLANRLQDITGCALSVLPDAPVRRFPQIDTGRLQALYRAAGDRWMPTRVEDALARLLDDIDRGDGQQEIVGGPRSAASQFT